MLINIKKNSNDISVKEVNDDAIKMDTTNSADMDHLPDDVHEDKIANEDVCDSKMGETSDVSLANDDPMGESEMSDEMAVDDGVEKPEEAENKHDNTGENSKTSDEKSEQPKTTDEKSEQLKTSGEKAQQPETSDKKSEQPET